MRPRLLAPGVLALLLATAPAMAQPLLSRRPGAADAPAERGIRARALLALDAAALAALRGRAATRVERFPLGRDRDVTLDVARAEPFRDARLVEMTAAGTRALAVPDTAYFTGTVAGEPASRVLLAAGATRVRGFVVTGETAYVFGPDAQGTLRTYDLRDVDATVHAGPGVFCDNDLHTALVETPLALGTLAATPPAAANFTGQILRVDVAIETDTELRAKFADSTAALDYIGALVAAANTIYERDLGLQLNASYVRLWTTTDPWTASSTDGQLDQLQAHWTNPANDMLATAGPRALVHMLSGKTVTGGIAYIAAICDLYYGFGVSQIDGDFDLAYPSQIWDVVVFTHELGHNVGSQHSHCYDPPLDRCYNQEPGCYSGTVVTSHGSIMSYCHTRPGGLANIDLLFPAPIVSVVRQTATQAGCLAPVGPNPCGNGVLDASEQCDDGNSIARDGCSEACRLEVCGNGMIDAGEECDDGDASGGDGCSGACRIEACGNGVLDTNEQCDDGGTTAGDGCAGDCTIERCPIVVSHQQHWAGGQVVVLSRGGNARLALKGVFGIPATTGSDVATQGMTVVLEDATGAVRLESVLTGGDRWKARGARAVYRDEAGTVDGLRKATVRTRARDGVIDVKVAVSGAGGAYPETIASMPRTVTVLLGDVAAVGAGACGRRTFGLADCRSEQAGARLLCR